MMILMFLLGLLLIVAVVLIVVALVKWFWNSKMPFFGRRPRECVGDSQKTLREGRDR